MSIKIPGEAIPDSTNLPDGIFDFRIESFEPVETQTGKLALKSALRVTGPKSHKGLVHYEQFTIGSNDDPQAREASTWASSFGAITCKKMCAKAGVKFSGDLENVARELEGQSVTGRVVYTVQPKFNKDGTENPYAGNARSQVKDWYEPGERTAGLGDGGAPAKAAPKAVKAPKAPPPPADDDDEDDAPPPPKAKKAKAAPPPDDDDEEDEPAPAPKSRKARAVAEDDDDED